MVSKWWKVKVALGLNACLLPSTTTARTRDELSPPPSERHSDAALLSPVTEVSLQTSPPAPVSSGAGLKWSNSLSRSSKKTCSICLSSMKRGNGHAIFTAECSHSFHFHCIASNVKHGNQVCPECRAKWTEIPLQFPSLDPPSGRARVNPVDWPQQNASMTLVRRLPPPRPNPRHNPTSFQAPEPAVFNDDESLDHQSPSSERNSSYNSSSENEPRTMQVKTYTEVSAIPQTSAPDNFTILINLKAPAPTLTSSRDQDNPALVSQTSRVPVDLVTVLDVSGSMAGTKLALLKRAMGFVIQNLGPNDRLTVIAFSSTARRLFPLRRMSESGRQQALQAVNLLAANGGTNIAEGLRKGAKVMEDRRYKNPVASIILLSDGQDTYTVSNAVSSQQQPNYHLLLPLSINNEESSNFKILVHTFGFGADHDASSMHSISEMSGGTFSFIETESVIQDAFAQCIGGLLSVVVKELEVNVECVDFRVSLCSLKAGSYPNQVYPDGRMGNIDVGDLYADEERDFLVTVNVPSEISNSETTLLKVRCVYNDPLTKELVTVRSEEVRIRRPEVAGQQDTSVEVDRQQNRLQAAEAMVLARAAAEKGDLSGAASILENCRKNLSESVSAKSHDRLCLALEAELKEMQERLASRPLYEASGRAYILSGLSSHSWQRATARGDSVDGSSLVHAYQTPSMTEMVTRSQATLLGSPSTQRLIRPALSFSFSSLPMPR